MLFIASNSALCMAVDISDGNSVADMDSDSPSLDLPVSRLAHLDNDHEKE